MNVDLFLFFLTYTCTKGLATSLPGVAASAFPGFCSSGDTMEKQIHCLKGLCHGIQHIFEQPKYIFVLRKTDK